jgi:hypothetical protein
MLDLATLDPRNDDAVVLRRGRVQTFGRDHPGVELLRPETAVAPDMEAEVAGFRYRCPADLEAVGGVARVEGGNADGQSAGAEFKEVVFDLAAKIGAPRGQGGRGKHRRVGRNAVTEWQQAEVLAGALRDRPRDLEESIDGTGGYDRAAALAGIGGQSGGRITARRRRVGRIGQLAVVGKVEPAAKQRVACVGIGGDDRGAVDKIDTDIVWKGDSVVIVDRAAVIIGGQSAGVLSVRFAVHGRTHSQNGSGVEDMLCSVVRELGAIEEIGQVAEVGQGSRVAWRLEDVVLTAVLRRRVMGCTGHDKDRRLTELRHVHGPLVDHRPFPLIGRAEGDLSGGRIAFRRIDDRVRIGRQAAVGADPGRFP